jgi:hypothetical protein
MHLSPKVVPESQASVRDGITSLLIGTVKHIFEFFFAFKLKCSKLLKKCFLREGQGMMVTAG